MGLGKALNEGIKHCQYELIARMDTDDISKSNRFEKQLEIFKLYPETDICSAWLEEFEGDLNNILFIKNSLKNITKLCSMHTIDALLIML